MYKYSYTYYNAPQQQRTYKNNGTRSYFSIGTIVHYQIVPLLFPIILYCNIVTKVQCHIVLLLVYIISHCTIVTIAQYHIITIVIVYPISYCTMGCLRLVGSINLQAPFGLFGIVNEVSVDFSNLIIVGVNCREIEFFGVQKQNFPIHKSLYRVVPINVCDD